MKNALHTKKDWLIEQYWKNGLSLREMEKKVGLKPDHGATITYWMNKHNIKRKKNPKSKREGVKYELLDDINWLTMQYWGFDLTSVEMAKLIGLNQGNKITMRMEKYDIPVKMDLQNVHHYPEWLIEYHYDRKMSIEKMAELANCSSGLISNLMNSYGLPIDMQIEHTERDERGRRWCFDCKRWLDIKMFNKNKNETDGLHARCKDCRKKAGVEHREIERAIAIQIYSKGTMNCKICSCEDIDILTFDHIKGEGYKHRKDENIKGQFYRWLKRNDYPDGFRILCWNCQHSERLKQYGKYKWDRDKDYNAEKRIIAFQIYSDGYMKCALCGCDDVNVLAIDHVNGEGVHHRKKIKTPIDIWLQRNNYPDGFRILCHNCNHREYLNRANLNRVNSRQESVPGECP